MILPSLPPVSFGNDCDYEFNLTILIAWKQVSCLHNLTNSIIEKISFFLLWQNKRKSFEGGQMMFPLELLYDYVCGSKET